MWFVLIVIVVVAAGWLYMAGQGTGNPGAGPDESAPVNAYDNPYDTNENNDRPFEPDACEASPADADSWSHDGN